MSVYELVKDAANIAKQVDNIELYSLLIDAKKESLDLIDENKQLKEEIKELKDNSEVGKSLFYKNNCYFKKDDERYTEPYCTKCWDVDNKLVRMHILEWPDRHSLAGECPSCKSRVYDIGK